MRALHLVQTIIAVDVVLPGNALSSFCKTLVMNHLRNMHIGRRLALGFGILLTLSILITAIGVLKLHAVANASRNMMEVPVAKERLISDWSRYIATAVVRTVAISKSTDPALAKFFAAEAAASVKASADLLKQIEPLLRTDEEKALFQRLMDVRKQYSAGRDGVVKLRNEGKADEAAKLLDETFIPTANRYRDMAGELLSLQRKYLDAEGARIADIEASSRIQMLLLAASILALSVLIGWFLTASITQPMRIAVAAARRVADGDLSGTIEVRSRDEAGELLQALQDMTRNLLRIVSQVRTGTEAIASASSEIAAGNQDLSSRTEQQASSLEETASSMEELTSTVRQNADNARQAKELAAGAADVAARGGEVVAQVVDTMAGIHGASKKVVDIISVIDGIAFQTNILALNAAVEAARAGEQGRGFAVVATEVRSLAQRSAAAAREIKALITDSVDQVGAGAALVDQAGKTMEDVVSGIRRVSDIVAEIAAASGEQSAGIAQVSGAIAQMDQVTQQNAALVEQAAAASEAMHAQSRQLSGAVSEFRLGDAPSPALPAAPVRQASIPARAAAARALPPARTDAAGLPAGGDWEAC
jgi:methyl-accepting chemotaxis protein